MMKFLKRRTSIYQTVMRLGVMLFLFISIKASAQPANNDCNNATTITVPNAGFSVGTYLSSTDDISAATVQTGETFAPAILVAGQNKKSMWYKFSISTTRAIRVTLAQPGTAITAGNAGFAVYKANTCLPAVASISTKLTPIATFGNTYHPCVDSGVYLIQVTSNNNANGPLYIQLQVSDTTGALYDHPAQAYNFGVVNPHNKYVDYLMSCQSVEGASERCGVLQNASQYHKSSWHTFTTPAYFDYLSILLSKNDNSYYVNSATSKKFGYTLYKGNAVTTPLSSLTVVDGCDSLLTNGYYAAYKMYKCADLEPNTTYSIQLFAHETFNDMVRLGIGVGGSAPTQAPLPILTASNNFGTLTSSASGTTTTLTDYLACNSRHSASSCSPALPSNGFTFAGKKYNLSSFFTFTLSTSSNVDFYAVAAAPTSCGPLLAIRLFRQGLTANCSSLDTINLIGTYNYIPSVDCLAPGTYTVQVSGTDTTIPNTSFHYATLTSNSAACLASNLGTKFSLRLISTRRVGFNKFSLSKAGAIDTINRVGGAIVPLVKAVTYQAASDTFGCLNTVRPADTTCGPTNGKVMYRLFAAPDSGIVTFNSLDWYFQYRLYKGDANALAISQNAFSYPSLINGLTAQTKCLDYYTSCNYKNVCVTAGAYTFATFGADDDIGRTDNPTMIFNLVSTKHSTPALAQDMGSVLDSVAATGGSKKSDIDVFDCKDNAVSINGYTPCKISGIAATKAIYRQFYLKSDALVSIQSNNACGFGSGMKTVFAGKATDGLAGLTPVGGRWNCFNSTSPTGCDLLPAGWYTIVSYGSGPTYQNPLQNVEQVSGYGSYIGQKDEITITLTVCASPKYNRPFKASVNTTQQPHLIQWKNRVGSTAAYPRTDTTYTLPTENFNCVDDIPFNLHPIVACDTTVKKVAYYVFRTTQETYLEINTSNQWGMVYALDARTDSASFATTAPIQPCVKGNSKIQLCRVPVGTYTLVIFAASTSACSSVTPTIYVDQVGVSRFDHANKSYDFGVVPPDSIWHRGKVGEVNPLNNVRAGSSDFFYCTTGTQPSDPTNAKCLSDDIYNMYDPSKLYMFQGNIGTSVNIVRRNLWYTFVVNKPGQVYVKVENKTPGKTTPYRFAVFRSNVDGSLPFSDVINSGLVDSTTAQGLTLLGQNGWPNYCNALVGGINFYRDPCTQFEPQRYYVLVENTNPYGNDPGDMMNPNNQVEVAILIDSANLVPTKYDHYYKAYDFGNVGAGTHNGGVDNFSCATRNSKDPIYQNASCAKTLWYKFTATVTGTVRYRIRVNGLVKYSASDIQLFKEDIAGDSTTKGLSYQSGASFYDNATASYWTQFCVAPGTYYLILPGCSQVNENVYPEIQLVEQEGDFCARPVVVPMTGAGTNISSVLINCHTIGTDYGEFNPNLTCPANGITNKYKSSWFRIDITGNDTLDVTAFLSENTNVLPADIKYRMMTGNCGAMQEQSCVLDAQTQNTYKCLVAGSYYIQVFTPITTTPTGSTLVTGDIKLNLSAIAHADTCAPINNCLANANFTPQFNCSTDSAVRFINFSTFGSTIKYQWDFGFGGQTSTAVSPAFNYPALSTAQTYNATLKVLNATCAGRDSVTIPITVPARPNFNLGPDTSLCKGGNITLNAATWTGTTYLWSTNATTSSIATTGTGAKTYWVKATYNGCSKTDTIKVYINTITSRNQTKILCGGDSVLLASARSLQEEHNWSTGEATTSIYVSTPAMYTNQIEWNGCVIIDTFNVFAARYPLGNDTTICLKQPYVLNATSPGATGYQWQSGSSAATFNATAPGLYWVKVNYGNCVKTDSINITGAVAAFKDTTAIICSSQPFVLPSGKAITAAGLYRDTVLYSTGCDSLVTLANLSLATVTQSNFSAAICSGQTYTLPWGQVVNTAGTYNNILRGESGCDSIKNTVTVMVNSAIQTNTAAAICAGENYTLPSGAVVNNPGIYKDTIRYASGCDSLVTSIQLVVRPLARVTASAAICGGQNYVLPSGLIVNTSGIYADTVRYVAGCDSLITTLTLSAKPLTRNSTTASICGGGSYTLPSGLVVNTSGVYNDTLRYVQGCDSVINSVIVSVASIIRQSSSASICSGQTYTLPSGKIVNVTGQYQDTVRYAAGCDSLITSVNLIVKTLATNTTSVVICASQTYTLPSGLVVNNAGVYNDTVRYITGCDSLITRVTLSVKALTRKTISAAICAGTNYTLPSGITVTNTGIYNDTLRYTTGCDSLINTVTLLVKSVTRQTSSLSICAGQSYTLPSGLIVNTAGSYIDTVRYLSGCDSLISSVQIAVKQLTRKTVAANICQGQFYTLPSGISVSTSGTFTDTVKYASGCDSLITTTTLTVKPVVTKALAPFVCAGQTYILPSGTAVNTSGAYRDTLRYNTGCDSVISIINLTVRSITRLTNTASICAGQSYTFPSGKVVNSAGIYLDTVRYTAGCDSLISNITLSLKSATRSALTSSICAGQSYLLPSGKSVSVTGIYNDTLRYTLGCDSLITTLNLIVRPVIRTSIFLTICAGQSYTLPSGATVNTTGSFNDTLRYTSGCDSSITILALQIKTPVLVNINPAICVGETYKLPSGLVVSTAGNYTDIIKGQSGCDSLVTTIKLTIAPNPSVFIIKSNDIDCILGSATLTASGGSKYLWSPAQSLNNATASSPVASPTTTTFYKVSVTSAQGCVTQDSIQLIVNKGDAASGYLMASAFTPNNDGKNDCFGVKSWGTISELDFSIFHRNGQLMYHTQDPSKCWDGTYGGIKVASGAYVYQVTANTICGRVFRKGTVVLIR